MSPAYPDWMELAEVASSPRHPPLSRPAPSSLGKHDSEAFVMAEEKLYREATDILGDTFAAREIRPDEEQPPTKWIEELGPDEAERKLVVARAGWLPVKDSPAFVQTARAFAVGRMKSEATKKGGNRTLNVQFVTMNTPPQEYEEVEVGRDK